MLIQEAVPLGAERVNVLTRTIQAGPAASEPRFAIVAPCPRLSGRRYRQLLTQMLMRTQGP
jgi:hypothetical protein